MKLIECVVLELRRESEFLIFAILQKVLAGVVAEGNLLLVAKLFFVACRVVKQVVRSQDKPCDLSDKR